MRGRRGAVALALALALAAFGSLAGNVLADSDPYGSLDRPGPPLSVPAAKLASALACTPGVSNAARNPILLVPGTNLDPDPNYSWNYERAFAALGWPYCTITLPDHTTGDIQTAGQYLVYALRTEAQMAGRQVDILGYSQGGMVPRWALRFWPDTRSLVNDYVALDPSNHGTLDAQVTCQSSCSPADWQQSTTAHFYDALNSRAETFAGIDYTVIFSRTDEIVVPNTDASGSSSLHTGSGTIANIAVQEICPNDASEHLAMGSYDPVGYALAIDAFTHPGPADPARIDPIEVCRQPFQPGVDPSMFPTDYLNYLNEIGQVQQSAPQVPAEPALVCYVFASCPIATQGSAAAQQAASPPGPRAATHHPRRRHRAAHKRRRRKHRHHRRHRAAKRHAGHRHAVARARRKG